MKFFLTILILSGLAYGGYTFYRQSKTNIKVPTNPVESQSKGNLIISQASDKLGNIASVLGASITSTYENGKEILNEATNGASEPIINELVSRTTETLKDLPRKEAEKIKYEFCRGVVEEYENLSTSN
jgi:hypothetical protein